MAHNPPPISAQQAYDYLIPLIDNFEASMQNIELPDEFRKDCVNTMQTMRDRATQDKRHKVAIVGRTGVGKSTLINALLKQQILSASASGACTAVATEISYKDIEDIEAVVEFTSRDEWKKELSRLLDDVNDKTVDTQEEVTHDTGSVSPTYQAREKILGVYPGLRNVPPENWNVEELLMDSKVDECLDRTLRFPASDKSNFQKELEQFLASALTGSDARALWPLVKNVKIMGPFEVLSTGITLVDLPGYGDVDNTRDSMANDYLKTADSICLVAGITRAKDDREIHSHLQNHLRQIILDGRVRERSIALILTGSDASIGSNEFTLPEAEQAKVDALKKDAIKLAEEVKVLTEKIQRKEKSTTRSKNSSLQRYQDQITQKRLAKDTKIREKNRLLALGRVKIVEQAIQDKYSHIYRDLSSQEDQIVPSIPIFCLGSRDYLCLTNIEPDSPVTFFDPEETGIPSLNRHLGMDGERRTLTEANWVLSKFCEFMARASQLSAKSAGDDKGTKEDAARKMDAVISNLEACCFEKLDRLVSTIGTVYDKLQKVVEKAVKEAEKQSPRIFESHENKKWNQYKAMMRQDGQYEGGSLNADLTETVLPEVQRPWNEAVNGQVPLSLVEFTDDIKKELADTIKLICNSLFDDNTRALMEHFITAVQSPDPSTVNLRKSLGLDTFLSTLTSSNNQATSSAQRLGTRAWESLMKEQLGPQYAKVCAEKGPGMYKRMKVSRKRRRRDCDR
ncbi:hypothetical protein GGX14DRAFT_460067 [Mycena pura]|uniref:Dynamin N-terminal domain-containing protein n=1 Tax=Mycena pura TaxID=153505 RepID=A0AAD6VDV2_9AGAR|nr:hypothetical protein GGX14DRAFT_460067 [Mycena pura]